MKYLVVYILSISFFVVNTYGKECDYCFKYLNCNNLTSEQQKDITDIRDEMIQKYNEIRNQIVGLRTNIQVEMRKDTPDWDKIKVMSDEELKLQEVLEEKISEYKENVRCLQIKNKANKK